jgi:hypothetical protein
MHPSLVSTLDHIDEFIEKYDFSAFYCIFSPVYAVPNVDMEKSNTVVQLSEEI